MNQTTPFSTLILHPNQKYRTSIIVLYSKLPKECFYHMPTVVTPTGYLGT